jgi:glycosyltransferase involved in cell wall biosynthesis
MSRPFRLAYLVSHPIQYQAPLLRRIASDPEIELTVFFCSDHSLRRHHDEGFGRDVEWDVPLLDGYDHHFLSGFLRGGPPTILRPFNRGLITHLRNGSYDALWVHGYMRQYHFLSMIQARLAGLVVLNRDEAWAQSAARGPIKKAVKKLFYGGLRRICHGWLTIGTANREYYIANGMAAETMFAMPYAVDNDSFHRLTDEAAPGREKLRATLGIMPGRPIILFASKFLARKRPDDLLEAFARIAADPACRNPYLLMVGDGERADALKTRTRALGLEASVGFTGFRNQSELPALYDLCDLFVLPSMLEPWGLVVNEVMNAGRAVIVSDQVGAAIDLVREGENGFVFPAGDVAALADRLKQILSDPARAQKMGDAGREIIADWGFAQDVAGLKSALAHFVGNRRG